MIGEVQHSGKVTWEGNLTLLEAIALAGGVNDKAKVYPVLVISGGIADPTLKLVDLGGILYRGELEHNISITRGDIVYVPTTIMASAERYFDFAVKALQPVLSAESAVILGGATINTLQGKTTTGTSINLNP